MPSGKVPRAVCGVLVFVPLREIGTAGDNVHVEFRQRRGSQILIGGTLSELLSEPVTRGRLRWSRKCHATARLHRLVQRVTAVGPQRGREGLIFWLTLCSALLNNAAFSAGQRWTVDHEKPKVTQVRVKRVKGICVTSARAVVSHVDIILAQYWDVFWVNVVIVRKKSRFFKKKSDTFYTYDIPHISALVSV